MHDDDDDGRCTRDERRVNTEAMHVRSVNGVIIYSRHAIECVLAISTPLHLPTPSLPSLQCHSLPHSRKQQSARLSRPFVQPGMEGRKEGLKEDGWMDYGWMDGWMATQGRAREGSPSSPGSAGTGPSPSSECGVSPFIHTSNPQSSSNPPKITRVTHHH